MAQGWHKDGTRMAPLRHRIEKVGASAGNWWEFVRGQEIPKTLKSQRKSFVSLDMFILYTERREEIER